MSPKRNKRQANAEPAAIEMPLHSTRPLPIIKVVGISSSGKSTLVRALRGAGYDARPVSQEHSHIPDLWQQFDRPVYLIYLNASLEDQKARRQDVTWSIAAHEEEVRRLTHAREHADLRINTTDLNPAGVCKVALSYLKRWRARHADQSLEDLPITGSATKNSPPNPKS